METTTQYAIIIRRSVYAGTLGIDGHARWLVDDQTGEAMTWPTAEAAREHIADLDRGVYRTMHGEAGRPEYWVVPMSAVEEVIANAEDQGRYDWPLSAVEAVGCTAPNGADTCGECDACREWMACEDDAILEGAEVEE